MQSGEVKIEVPWGYIAAKWYGSQHQKRPIVMLHGWQDNAGTFDTLIPLLSPEFSYLSIDFLGHGFSTWLPRGMCYTLMNYVQVLNFIRRHYKWEKISLCGHSMGACVATLYASLYPDRCDLLIAIDATVKPLEEDGYISLMQGYTDDFIVLDGKNQSGAEPPTYAYEEIIERWAKQSNVTYEGVEYLAKRGIKQSKVDSNRYYFTRDIRLKLIDFGRSTIPDDIHYKLIERVTAPHLFIKAGKSTVYEGADGVHRAVDIFKATNPKFRWIIVRDGGHHLHLTHPMLVSELISHFINEHRTNKTTHKL